MLCSLEGAVQHFQRETHCEEDIVVGGHCRINVAWRVEGDPFVISQLCQTVSRLMV